MHIRCTFVFRKDTVTRAVEIQTVRMQHQVVHRVLRIYMVELPNVVMVILVILGLAVLGYVQIN